jgi:CheY-like chemotaxis protein
LTVATSEDASRDRVLAAVGRLAGGVAHDFNNLLTAILSVTEARLETLAQDDPLRADFERIDRAAARAGTLTTQLLSFARKQIVQPRRVEVAASISALASEHEPRLAPNVHLTLQLCQTAASVEIDPSQLRVILEHLIVNACEAMPLGGDLTVETANVTLLPDDVCASDDVTPGPYVMVAIRDTGVGMDHPTIAHACEPFFTTKAPGHSGLGLATVYGLVKQASGHITLHSVVGRGSCVRVYFPFVRAVSALSAGAERAAQPASRGASEIILLVEDDDLVRSAAMSVLRNAGYRVVEARGPGPALELFGQHEDAIDLVLTDVVMPGMNGRELVDVLRARRPELPVLYMSGYTHDAIVRAGVLESGIAFLQKPFSRGSLTCKVREALDRRSVGIA